MKFKKTHFLLMAIAIVLLIGIGSVCASENVTDDSSDMLADDGTDVVLSDDTDGSVLDDTSEEKTNTTVETEKESYEYKQDDTNKTISVDVKDNKSMKIDVNKSDLSIIDEKNNVISFEYNSSVITITGQLDYGYHNLTINYLGNASYNNSSKIVPVKIFGNNTIITETSVVCDGKNVEIPVTINDQAGNITMVKENFNLTLVYVNETGNVSNLTNFDFEIIDGKIKFTSPVDKLINASLIIDYTNATEPRTVAIKVSTEIIATVVKGQYESEEIKNISIEIKDGQGNLINVSGSDLEVFENGVPVEFTYNNNNITITSISEGSHNLTIVYKGNETYNESNTTAVLKVYGKNQIIVPAYVVSNNGETVEIHIIIFNGLENITIEPNNLTLNLTYTNQTGNVTSAIIGTDKFEIAAEELIIQNIGYPLTQASLSIDYVNSTGAKTVKINLLTTVEAIPANPKYRYNETNNITVTVKGYDGNLTISKNDLKVFDNGKEIQFTFNNTNITVNLEQGVHNLTVTYQGNETYNSSSTTIEVKVYGDARINPDEIVILGENNITTIFVNLNDGADPIDIVKNKLNVTLFYTVGNQTLNKTINLDDIVLNGQNITFGVNDDFDSAYVHIVYDNNLTGNTTLKVNTVITAPDTLIYGQSEEKNITIDVKGTNGHAINITNENIQVLNNGKALTISVNGSVVTIKDALSFGVYNLTIKYLGTATYIESTKALVLTVYGINATSNIDVNSTKEGTVKINIISGNETVDFNVDDLILNVTYKNGNDTVVIPISTKELNNRSLIFKLENGNFTSAILNIKYNNTEVNVTLNRVYNVNVEVINNQAEYQSGKFIYRIVDIDAPDEAIANKTISMAYSISSGGITFQYSLSANTNATGEVEFDNAKVYVTYFNLALPIGNNTVTLSGSNLKFTNGTQTVVISKANINIKIDEYKEYYGSDKKIKITVTNAKTGDPVKNTILHLYLPVTTQKDYYFQTSENGTSEINVKGFVGGTYDLTVSNNDTENINNKSVKGSFTILKIPVKTNAKDVTVYYNSGVTETIKVTKDGKAISGMYVFVRLYTTSKKYSDYLFQTNDKGQISFSASLAVGKHKIIITSADNRYEFNQATKTIKVKKASGKFTAKKVTAYYKGGKYFTVKLTNTKNKKPIYDAKVNIKLFISKNRYYNYNGNTGMNGQLKLLLDNLKPGKYKIVIACADSKNYAAKEITSKIVIKKAPAKLAPKKLTAKKGAKKYFKVTVKNKKTKKVIKGVKVKIKVYTGKKAKTYTAKTNAKGIAKISSAKLKVGKHKVVVTSANKYVVAKKAKSTIKIKK